jgi:hypothetical protein
MRRYDITILPKGLKECRNAGCRLLIVPVSLRPRLTTTLIKHAGQKLHGSLVSLVDTKGEQVEVFDSLVEL